jgi:hypothetical protein
MQKQPLLACLGTSSLISILQGLIDEHIIMLGVYASRARVCRYVFLYAVHYFFAKTKMTGFFQTCFYFGYTLIFCLGLAIMTGAIGYLGSAVFVRRIYRNIKCD